MTTRFVERRAVRCAWAVALAAALVPTHASAEPTAADADSARTLVQQGRELKQRGDVGGALARFRAAYTLFPTPIVGMELGSALADAGHLIESRETYLAAARLPHLPDESEKSLDTRAAAERRASDLRSRIAHVTFRFMPRAPTEPVVLDGAPLGAEALLVPRAVDPGVHAVGFRATRTEFVVGEGETREVLVDVPAVDATPGGGRKAPQPVPYLTYTGLAAAGVFTLAGTVTGIVALARASDVKNACPDGHCPPDAHDDLRSARTWGAVSTAAFIGVALSSGLVLVGWLFEQRPTQAHPPTRAHLPAQAQAKALSLSF